MRGREGKERKGEGERTEHDDVEDKNDKSQDSTTGAVLPRVAVSSRRNDILGDGGCARQERQPELGEKGGEDGALHIGEGISACFWCLLLAAFFVAWCRIADGGLELTSR